MERETRLELATLTLAKRSEGFEFKVGDFAALTLTFHLFVNGAEMA